MVSQEIIALLKPGIEVLVQELDSYGDPGAFSVYGELVEARQHTCDVEISRSDEKTEIVTARWHRIGINVADLLDLHDTQPISQQQSQQPQSA